MEQIGRLTSAFHQPLTRLQRPSMVSLSARLVDGHERAVANVKFDHCLELTFVLAVNSTSSVFHFSVQLHTLLFETQRALKLAIK